MHRSVVDEFVAECKRAVVELYGTDPVYSKTINAGAVERLTSLIGPEKIVYRGEIRPWTALYRSDQGRFGSEE